MSGSCDLVLSTEECTTVVRTALHTDDVVLLNHKLIANTPDGFNGLYFSLLINYQLSNSSEIKELSCFLKSVPKNDRHFWYINGTKLLLKEYEMYENLVPAMERHVNFNIPIPRYYYIRLVPEDQFQNVLVMENLKDKGFVMRNPRVAMNFDECCLALKAIAKLHAGSVVFQQKEGRSILDICTHPEEALWVNDPENPAYPWLQSSVDTLIDVAAEHPQFRSRLASTAAQATLSEAYRRLRTLIQPSDQHLNVICHGDIWSNNLMFQYINNRVSDVILVDLQVYRYAPPITEVLMFIYLNTTREFRDENKAKLIRLYSEEIQRILESEGCEVPQDLTLEGLERLEVEFKLFALVTASGYVPMGQLPPEARVKTEVEGATSEGARDFDVLRDFLNSRGVQVWRGMQMSADFKSRVEDALDELLTYLHL